MIDLTGWGAILVGLAAVIAALVPAYSAIKNTKTLDAIDHAVNGKPAGAQTLQSQVADIHSDRPPPPPLPPELNNAAVREMLQFLVASEHERRSGNK